jgi:hypothetical protein
MLLLAALVALAGYSCVVFVRGLIWAVEGEGDPEIIWPAVAILAATAYFLSRSSWRIWRRLRRASS